MFNPGDATLVADALRELESARRAIVDEACPPLRRAAARPQERASTLTGDALESLLDPVRQVGEDDEFTLASSKPSASEVGVCSK